MSRKLAVKILAIAALAGGGAYFGRKLINRQIEKRLPQEIEIAKATAVDELHKKFTDVVTERLVIFARNLFIKGLIVGALFILFYERIIDATAFRTAASLLLAAFLIRDSLRALPFIAPAIKIVRAHGWHGGKAFKEFVAGVVFEHAYAEALIALQSGPNRMWIALSKYSAQNICSDVAMAVADVARTVSVDIAKQRALLAGSLALVMAVIYSVYLHFVFQSA